MNDQAKPSAALQKSPAMQKVLRAKLLNQSVVRAEYAVRGEIALRAEHLRHQLALNPSSLPFTEIVNCNIGNPQQLGQHPITFFRQVASLVEYGALLDDKNKHLIKSLFPQDAVERARTLLRACGGNIGAYSHSQGILHIRQNVAEFIGKRDGYPANADNVFLTAGASQGVQYLLQCMVQNDNVGVMIPIPQYPLYTATLALTNGKPVPYYLNEQRGWSLSVNELSRSLTEARQAGTEVRALCVINPGNPTGNTLSAENIQEIIEFCRDQRLVILADEVYQTNTYTTHRPFVSFRKVLKSMGAEYENMELVSFHSISKGTVGECGRRGGYFELNGFDPEVKEQLYKLASIGLCPTVQGQILVDLMVKPPVKGEESFELYEQEYNGIFESLHRRSVKLVKALNEMEGVSCQLAEGAMYVFPSITIPKRAQEQALKLKKSPDSFYVMELLNATGVCMVPGSGFGQLEGSFHYRSTFLPPEEVMDVFIDRIAKFHKEFVQQWK